MEKVELLAPCGGFEQLRAAVQAGADAVYLGGKHFNARIGASNFDDEELKEAIKYAHLRGVKVYVTINTLLFDDELKDAVNYVGKLYSYNADALIIQDFGLAYLIRNYFPDFELHLSTQATIYNESGAKAAKELGFARIVAAREMSIDEIKKMCSVCETEVFVHGAVCVCYSGQCQMSRSLGERSANRGTCAQPCRLPYEYDDGKWGYFLSPKDMSYIDHISELIEAGVSSFKIEGRMKSPEYVGEVVNIYRKYIDLYYSGKYTNVSNTDKLRLRQIFSRGEFSDGYIKGEIDNIFVEDTPKHNGLLIGHVMSKGKRKTLRVRLTHELNIGDGVEIRGGNVEHRRMNGNIVTYISEIGKGEYVIGDIVGDIRQGDLIYRVSNKKQMEEIRRFIAMDTRKKSVSMNFFAGVGMPPSLTVICDGIKVTINGKEAVQEAINTPLAEERVKNQLCKTGNSTFETEDIRIKLNGSCAIPISQINKLRREALKVLSEKMTKCRNVSVVNPDFPGLNDIMEKNHVPEKIDSEFSNVTKGWKDREIESKIKLGEFAEKNILINNLGWSMELKNQGAKLFAGSGFNITNGAAAKALREFGIIPTVVSGELIEKPDVLMIAEAPIPERVS